jgi:hypothetical protein
MITEILVAATLFAQPGGISVWNEPTISQAASALIGRDVEVRCYYQEEIASPQSLGAWGYVYSYEPVIHLDGILCAWGREINNNSFHSYLRAQAVIVIAHEAFHLHPSLSDTGSEARTECRAIKNFKKMALLLGANEEVSNQLYLYGKKLYFWYIKRNPIYHWKGCRVE